MFNNNNDQKILAEIREKLLKIQEDLNSMENKEDVMFIETDIQSAIKRVEFCSIWNLINEMER